MNEREIASFIDHTLLKADTTQDDIQTLTAQAIYYGFKTVCVNSGWVQYAYDLLSGSGVGVTSVIGFPLGAMSGQGKLEEAVRAIEDGATELDIVMNIGYLKSGDYDKVLNELSYIIAKATPTLFSDDEKIITKVIIETGLLTDDEKILATQLSNEAGADFVKTCTGFNKGEATVEDLRLMLEHGAKSVKASGGVNTLAKFNSMIEAGATRVGTSSGIKIIRELSGELNDDNSSY